MPSVKQKRKFYKKRTYDKNVEPWYSCEEYNEVAEKLFSKDVEEKEWALDTLRMWKARNAKKFGVAMEVTIPLLGAYIQDLKMEQGKVPMDETNLVSQYGLAFARFVTLVSDKTRNELVHKISLKTAACEFGIPDHMVELRHDIIHYNLPSLHYLRKASLDALNWLQDNFWQAFQQESVTCVLDSGKIEATLGHYQHLHIQSRLGKKVDPKLKKNLEDCFQELKFQLGKYPEEFFKILAGPYQLLPPSPYMDYLAQSRGGLEQVDIELLPVTSLYVWGEVVRLLEDRQLLQPLAEHLLLNLDQHSQLADAAALAWVTYLLDAFPFFLWNWRNLLRCALKSPCRGVESLLARIIDNQDPPLDKDTKDKLDSIVSIYLGNHLKKPTASADREEFHTKEEIEKLVQAHYNKTKPAGNPHNWTLWIGKSLGPLGSLQHNYPDPETPEAILDIPSEDLRMDYIYDHPRCPQQARLSLADPALAVSIPSQTLTQQIQALLNTSTPM